ncbi:MAG: nitroreductase [Oscillospiraceae bacterium]|jgi:nitroreductase|nr:nitroreductase [Oscillospiraceae bacterium]
MEVFDAIKNRRSVRAFLPSPVDRDTLEAVFGSAARTSSWANTQPWEVFAAVGDVLERIRAGYREKYDARSPSAPETEPPRTWSESSRLRQQQLYPDMMRASGITADEFGELSQSMFNAPVVAYICMDKALSAWSLYDIGAYSQSILLAAYDRGLGGIQAITLTLFPDVIRRELRIPMNLKITIGIALGYPDTGNPINSFVSARASLGDTVHILG